MYLESSVKIFFKKNSPFVICNTFKCVHHILVFLFVKEATGLKLTKTMYSSKYTFQPIHLKFSPFKRKILVQLVISFVFENILALKNA